MNLSSITLSFTKKLTFIFFATLIFLFPALSAAEASTSPQVSAIFVDITHPKILSAENPALRLTPASTTKLFIAAAALKQWGSGYTFTTPVYQRGSLNGGLLKGDLVLYGIGDPALTNEKLWQLANNLQQTGLKKIEGDIVVNNSFLGKISVNDLDRAKAKTHAEESYNGLLSSAGSNFGTVGIRIFPAKRAGEAAHLFVLPFNSENIVLTGQVVTRATADQPIQLIRETVNNKEILHVSGDIALDSKPVTIYRSVGNPDLETAVLLKGFLQQAGVSVSGKIRVESTPLKPNDTILASVESDPLIEILREMLWFSNNYMADLLTLDLWREQQKTLASPILLSDATKPLINFFQTCQQNSGFIIGLKGLPILDSGSGLTPSNRIAAQDFVVLLSAMYQNKKDFPAFYGDLITPGMFPKWFGINTQAHPWFNRISIKPGSMKMPTGVFSLAGYFRMKNGDLGAFALLINQQGVTPDKLVPVLLNKLDGFFTNY